MTVWFIMSALGWVWLLDELGNAFARNREQEKQNEIMRGWGRNPPFDAKPSVLVAHAPVTESKTNLPLSKEMPLLSWAFVFVLFAASVVLLVSA